MTSSIYSPDEQALIEAWLRSDGIDGQIDNLLIAAGFEANCDPYTRLDAWVGAFAVAEIQSRLPNCGICREDGVILTRKFREVPDRKVTGMIRHLFTINWADSAPGISWPVAYNLVWLPGFDRFVVTASADGTDMFGYCDFALGHFGADEDWRQAAKEILQGDWRGAYESWDQAPWAYLFDSGVVPEAEAMAWRAEAWAGHADFEVEDEELDDDSDEEVVS